ncbi:MAG TPA: hypothetical protein VFW66_08435 [Gemmatimonadales bacterium]|nr:hypothetical protein [Gemmatimonadales bacterium]
MKTSILVGGIALALTLAAQPARAQIVEAGVVIRSGPVAGHVIYGPPVRRVVVERYAPRVIVVERVHVPHGRANGWWRKHGYRATTVYYYGDDGRYYDRGFDGRTRVRAVVVYERGGRYYRPDDDNWRDRRPYRGHDRDD